MTREHYDLIIAGAGASGLFCAGEAVARGMRVLIVEQNNAPGKKLLLAGGGKGNVTNRSVSANDYVGENPAFTAQALANFTPDDFLERLDRASIAIEEREHGQIFCRRSGRAVLDMLLAAAAGGANAPVRTSWKATRITRLPEEGFQVENATGALCAAPRLVLATGSPAWPQCGADDSGLHLARSLGHRIVPVRPVLSPLVLPDDAALRDLAGLSLPVRAYCVSDEGPQSPLFDVPLLFTHKGCSGPAVLQLSCYWRKGMDLCVDFLPGMDFPAMLDAGGAGKSTPRSLLSRHMPDRAAAALLPPELADRRVAELSRAHRTRLGLCIHAARLKPGRSEGLNRAEACAGGVDTREVNPRTMESLLVPGLFFCGEILDVAGKLGGYNLQWAWASAFTLSASL